MENADYPITHCTRSRWSEKRKIKECKKNKFPSAEAKNADLVLNISGVADIHAFVHFEGQQAFLTHRFPSDGLPSR
jgi:hypothetical protein